MSNAFVFIFHCLIEHFMLKYCSSAVCQRHLMVHYRKRYGECHVCGVCKPGTWFRCVVCGIWMGMSCNPRGQQVTHYHKDSNGNPLSRYHNDSDARFASGDVSLHCYIWTSDVKDRSQRADLCCECAANAILPSKLPTSAKRLIWQYVSWGSWW